MYAVIAEPSRDILNWGSKTEVPSIKDSPHLLSSRHLTWDRGCKIRPYLPKYHASATKYRFISLRCHSSPRVRTPFIVGPNRKSLKLSAFKSNVQNDDSGSRPSASKSLNKSVGFSYAPSESEVVSLESPKAGSIPAYPTDAESTAGSLAIQNLFKSWLMLLRVPSAKQTVDETPEETSTETSGAKYLTQQNEKTRIIKAAWCYFMGLDATIKMPLLIFIPWYLAVNFMYGPEVAKDLYPLWIFGPFIAALYVKLLQSICALYMFSFKQSVKVLRNLPVYYVAAYKYIFGGRLKENMQGLLQRVVDIKNMDYKEALIRIVRNLNSWIVEKYLDYVESVWPYYCRTVRFLKRAHLI